MKKAILTCILLLFVSQVSQSSPQNATSEIILCGREEVYILDINRLEGNRPQKVWSWKAKDRPEIPEAIRGKFGTTDECKSIDGGKKVLVTSSGGGVALVDRKTGKAQFYAVVEYAHSADILPGGRVAVAGSDEGDEKGNCLTIFDLRRSNKPIYSERLFSGHGVVWDNMRQTLWALADEEINAYKLRDWQTSTPSLTKIASYKLPEPGGHDLFPLPSGPMLSTTTYAHCWLFDRDTHKFSPHSDLPNNGWIKSLMVNPVTGQLAYVKADRGEWWSETLRLLHPQLDIRLPGEWIYKARWVMDTTH